MNNIITIALLVPVFLMLFGFIMAGAHYIKENKATYKVVNYGLMAGFSHFLMTSVVYWFLNFPPIALFASFIIISFFLVVKRNLDLHKS